MSSSRYADLLVVDTETTGQDPFKHEILSVGMVSLSSDECAEFHVEVPDGAGWTEFGRSNFSRFESAWTSTAAPAHVVVRDIENFVSKTFHGREVNLVGHNMAFDRFFLAKLAFRAGVSQIKGISHRTVDTFSLLMSLHLLGRIPLAATTSEGAFKYFGISVPATSRHTALGDAAATKELFIRVMEELGSG